MSRTEEDIDVARVTSVDML